MTKVVTSQPTEAAARPRGRIRKKSAMWIYIIGPAATPALLQSQIGIGFSPILSASMSPAANAGDLFLTKVVKASTLKVGDIITVRDQVTGIFYAHRIAKMRNANSVLRILTNGDANPIIDQDPYIISSHGDLSKEIFLDPWFGAQ